jgi:hypothetical protein
MSYTVMVVMVVVVLLAIRVLRREKHALDWMYHRVGEQHNAAMRGASQAWLHQARIEVQSSPS